MAEDKLEDLDFDFEKDFMADTSKGDSAAESEEPLDLDFDFAETASTETSPTDEADSSFTSVKDTQESGDFDFADNTSTKEAVEDLETNSSNSDVTSFNEDFDFATSDNKKEETALGDFEEPQGDFAMEDQPTSSRSTLEPPEVEEASFEETASTKAVKETSSSPRRFWLLAALTSILGATLGGLALFILYPFKGSVPSQPLPQVPLEEVAKEVLPHTVKEVAALPQTDISSQAAKYFVQIATCELQICVEDYQAILKSHGYQPTIVPTMSTVSMMEVLSQQLFSNYEADQWSSLINREHELAGYAYRKKVGTHYCISVGLFPNLETATHIKTSLNYRFGGQLQFTIKPTSQSIRQQQIRIGDFDTRQQALNLQHQLSEKHELFRQAQIRKI